MHYTRSVCTMLTVNSKTVFHTTFRLCGDRSNLPSNFVVKRLKVKVTGQKCENHFGAYIFATKWINSHKTKTVMTPIPHSTFHPVQCRH